MASFVYSPDQRHFTRMSRLFLFIILTAPIAVWFKWWALQVFATRFSLLLLTLPLLFDLRRAKRALRLSKGLRRSITMSQAYDANEETFDIANRVNELFERPTPIRRVAILKEEETYAKPSATLVYDNDELSIVINKALEDRHPREREILLAHALAHYSHTNRLSHVRAEAVSQPLFSSIMITLILSVDASKAALAAIAALIHIVMSAYKTRASIKRSLASDVAMYRHYGEEFIAVLEKYARSEKATPLVPPFSAADAERIRAAA